MTVQRPQWLQNVGNVYTAEEMRRNDKLKANRRDGVNGVGDFAVSQNGTPNMTCNVAAGEALVNGSETLQQGLYYVQNDAVVNRTIAASDATNPRRDLVVIRVRDQFYSGTFNDADVIVVTGTPAPSPADPSAPANSLVLARIAVAANATTITNANITDLRVWQAQRLFPGPQGLHVRNSGDTADTLALDNNGFVILGGAISVPPAFGSALAPSSYGTVPVKIDEQVLGAPSATIRFPVSGSLPQTFRALRLHVRARSDLTGPFFDDIHLQCNADTGANYGSANYGIGIGAGTMTTFQAASETYIRAGAISSNSATVGMAGTSIIDIDAYTEANWRNKHVFSTSMRSESTSGEVRSGFGVWMPASAQAITSILLSCGGLFMTNSRFALYGLP